MYVVCVHTYVRVHIRVGEHVWACLWSPKVGRSASIALFRMVGRVCQLNPGLNDLGLVSSNQHAQSPLLLGSQVDAMSTRHMWALGIRT